MFNTFSFFFSRPSRKSDWPATLEAWLIYSIWMQSTVGGCFTGILSSLYHHLLSTGLKHTAPTSQPQVVHPLCASTTTPMLPLPSTVPIVGVTEAPAATAMSSSIEGTTPSSHGGPEMPSKCCQILTLLIP